VDQPQKHLVMVHEVELLGVTAGNVGRPVAIVSLRFDPAKSFAVTNVAIAKAQVERLVEDLIVLLETSETFKE
jgi:hypothetical protein